MRETLNRSLAIASLVFLVVASVVSLMGSTPNSRQRQGHRYRWIFWDDSSVTDTVSIRFPRLDKFSGNDNEIPVSADSLRSANWIHISQVENAGANEQRFVIFSPTFRHLDGDGKAADTVYVTNQVKNYTFGGCQIDSIRWLPSDIGGVTHNILVTD